MRTLLLTAMAYLLLLTTTTSATTTTTHPPHVTRYIESHYQIAVRESERSGIPASVILAQGILESSWGLGKLSTNSNNHFGIKCKSSWTGPTYYHKDDDRNSAGVLIESCFRAYGSVEESYIDHTNFLVEGKRYEKLFSYDRTDYKNWSIGLKDCGYATAEGYGEKLIEMIEKYKLAQYDRPSISAVSAPVFHIPSPEPKPQTTIPQESIDLTISPTVVKLMHSDVESEVVESNTFEVTDEIPPAAVNIENHVRYNNNTNEVNQEQVVEAQKPIQTEIATIENTTIIETEFMQEALEEEEIYEEAYEAPIGSTVVVPEPEGIIAAPSYQIGILPKVDMPKEQEELTVTKAEDNHLQVMKGKMRVARKPRQ